MLAQIQYFKRLFIKKCSSYDDQQAQESSYYVVSHLRNTAVILLACDTADLLGLRVMFSNLLSLASLKHISQRRCVLMNLLLLL